MKTMRLSHATPQYSLTLHDFLQLVFTSLLDESAPVCCIALLFRLPHFVSTFPALFRFLLP